MVIFKIKTWTKNETDSVIWLDWVSLRRTSMAINGLCSTNSVSCEEEEEKKLMERTL